MNCQLWLFIETRSTATCRVWWYVCSFGHSLIVCGHHRGALLLDLHDFTSIIRHRAALSGDRCAAEMAAGALFWVLHQGASGQSSSKELTRLLIGLQYAYCPSLLLRPEPCHDYNLPIPA